jgi:hypothetical protein
MLAFMLWVNFEFLSVESARRLLPCCCCLNQTSCRSYSLSLDSLREVGTYSRSSISYSSSNKSPVSYCWLSVWDSPCLKNVVFLPPLLCSPKKLAVCFKDVPPFSKEILLISLYCATTPLFVRLLATILLSPFLSSGDELRLNYKRSLAGGPLSRAGERSLLFRGEVLLLSYWLYYLESFRC